MGQRLKLGIAGCGEIAGYTAFFARLNRGIELVACCDALPARAAAFARRHGIRHVYPDYAAMLAQAPLQAVYLAVPHHLHFEMIAMAIARGLPVLAEKPITRTLAEGVQVACLAQAAGVKLAVNYQYRYDRGCYALARAAQAGALGELRYARINVPWNRTADYFDQAAWHKRLDQAGGGTLLTQGSHFLDIALWACGQPAVAAAGVTAQRVFTDVEVEDLAMGIVELANGALVEVCSSLAAGRQQAATIELYGSLATGFYTDRPWPRARFLGRRVPQPRPPVWGVHALQRSLEGFRRWVTGGGPPLVTAEDALVVLAVIEAIYRSAETGRKCNVEVVHGSHR